MRINRTEKRKPDTSSGVSEIIGAILLISIVVLLIGIIGIFLFSQPTPQKIPSLNFMTGINSDKTKLFIYHNGGDTLVPGEFSVLLDGVPKSYSVAGGGSWSLGKNLEVDITPSTMPQSIQLVYNNTASSGGTGSTGAVLLDEASANIVRTGDVSPDQLPYLDCSAVRNWACADQIPLDIVLSRIVATSQVRRINFVMNDVNNGITGQLGSMNYHFNFTVSKANSSIVFGNAINGCNSPRIVPLGPNDKVSISFPTGSGPEYFILYGIAPSIWEMSGGGGGDILVTAYNSTTHLTTTNTDDALCHTWITEYNNIESTMQINGVPVSGAPYTNLIVNTTTYINGPFSSSNSVVLDGFRPTENGMFLVSFPGNSLAPLYTIGWADQIRINGVIQTGLGL